MKKSDKTAPQQLEIFCRVDEVKTQGFVLRRDLSTSERLKRGGRIFGVLILIGMVTLFVPMLHFILPPLALLIGGTLGFSEYMTSSEIVRGEIPCPNCKVKIDLAKESEDWPKKYRCSGCYYTLTIESNGPAS